MAASRIGANARKQLDVIAIHEAEPSFGIKLHKLLDVFRVDPSVIATGLPSVAGVIAKLLLLNPDCGFGKKVDATHVIPVGMADDDVRDFFRLNASEFHGFVRANVFGGREFFEKRISVVAAVEKNVAAYTAD